MDLENEIFGTGERFSEVLEAKIEAKEGVFVSAHPFLRTACRGLAARLQGSPFVPDGLVMATELYINDMQTGTDGFTGEPMPEEVMGFPKGGALLVRLATENIAREAFGDEFVEQVQAVYAEINPDK